MEIYQIKNLDCTKKSNRIKLSREVSSLFGRESALTGEQMQKAATKISNKYGYKISQIQYSLEHKEEKLCWVFIDTDRGYSQYRANSRYEIYAKFVLLVNEFRKIKKREAEV